MEDLGALLADGDAFSVEPDDAGFTVGYDDVLAHEYADLVAESIAVIAAVPGVADVIHEDREIILVRAGGGVTERQITTALDSFWRAAAKKPLPWNETLKTLATAVAPTLKAAGFRKQALRWNRETTPGFVQVIELSRAEAGEGYVGTIDVGLFDEELARLRHRWARPKFVGEVDCQVRHSMGTFALTDDPSALRTRLEGEVLPFVDAHPSRRALLAAEAEGSRLLNPIDRAIGLALEGDPATAHGLLQERFDRTQARAHIVEVAARLGLPPLATGADPTRSRAEEAFLPQWLAGQERALERFRAAMSDAGIAGAELDGSLGSLEHLRPDRWRPVVAHLQTTEPATAPSPLMQLPRGAWSHFDRPAIGAVVPNHAVRQLAEDLAAYLGWVLQRAVPPAAWVLQSTGFGLAPAMQLPGRKEAAAVTKVAVEYATAALHPLTPEQDRLYRRYHPLRADVDRWLDEAAATPAMGRRRRWFRRG